MCEDIEPANPEMVNCNKNSLIEVVTNDDVSTSKEIGKLIAEGSAFDNPHPERTLEDVNLLYKKLRSHLRQRDNIKKLCADIDEVSSNLRTITKLEQCKELEMFVCDGANVNEAKRRHEEQLKQINSNWWEKLDIYDVA